MRTLTVAWGVILLAGFALAGCDKAVNSGNATAPGSPATGNPREVTAPVAADSPLGGGGDAVPGTTGRGTLERGGRSQGAQAGIGTAGGLGGSSGLGLTGSFPTPGASSAGGVGQAAAAPDGSTHRAPATSVSR